MNRAIVYAFIGAVLAAMTWPLSATAEGAQSSSDVSDEYANAQGAVCAKGNGQPSIDACTWAIQSGLWGADVTFAYYNRGNTYDDMGNYARALADFDQVIALDPSYTHALGSRGNAYYHLGQFSRAIQDYDRAIALQPNDALSLHNRGQAKLKIGDTVGGDADLDAADALDNDGETGGESTKPTGNKYW